jgi:hypothetical protein
VSGPGPAFADAEALTFSIAAAREDHPSPPSVSLTSSVRWPFASLTEILIDRFPGAFGTGP